jgi:hypothetical protein
MRREEAPERARYDRWRWWNGDVMVDGRGMNGKLFGLDETFLRAQETRASRDRVLPQLPHS